MFFVVRDLHTLYIFRSWSFPDEISVLSGQRNMWWNFRKFKYIKKIWNIFAEWEKRESTDFFIFRKLFERMKLGGLGLENTFYQRFWNRGIFLQISMAKREHFVTKHIKIWPNTRIGKKRFDQMYCQKIWPLIVKKIDNKNDEEPEKSEK